MTPIQLQNSGFVHAGEQKVSVFLQKTGVIKGI